MNILFYYNWPTQRAFFGIVLDEVHKLQAAGHHVEFLTCNSFLSNCFVNTKTDRNFCKLCEMNNSLVLSSHQIKNNKLGDFLSLEEKAKIVNEIKFNYQSIKDIKKLKYKEALIGYGALSSYVSFTRNQEPIFDEKFKKYFDAFLYSQVYLYEAFQNFNSKNKFDLFYIYNGRWADMRPVYDFCLAKGIDIRILESVQKKETVDYRKEVYKNCLPHNIENRMDWIQNAWASNRHTEEEKKSIGESFFNKRKNAELARDVKVYTLNQKPGKLPSNWDDTKRNIVIFSSSDDEYVALGKEYENENLGFENQEEAITMILDNVKESNVQFYLRIHPNMAPVDYGYHKRLYRFASKYPIEVISPTSDISTYALIDHASLVIAFNSTTGIEACFWGKPVISLYRTAYEYLNVAYKPKSREEVLSLISTHLKPLSKADAIKFGYFMLSIEEYTEPISLNPVKKSLLGKSFFTFPYFKPLGSSLIGRFVLGFMDSGYQIRQTFTDKNIYEEIPIKGKN